VSGNIHIAGQNSCNAVAIDVFNVVSKTILGISRPNTVVVDIAI
jgi:hypothetical protein